MLAQTNDQLLTIREFAALIRRSVDTVRRMIGDGSITAINCGTDRRAVWMIRQADVERFFERRANRKTDVHRRRNVAEKSRELDALLK